ncbi:MAG: hypothetical protein K8R59_12385 [Thermoanaerobaculales bacterium]|nr:hypothetical protein [Thermoanaerobaculales bacterium]
MTNLMFELRRSPRTLLERDGYPGPGPGKLALVMGRAGVGKTAFIVGIGIDALLSGQKVLHISLERTVDKVRGWYDDLLMEMLRREKKLEHWAAIQLDVERRRHIHTYFGGSFTIDRLRQALDLLENAMDFKPQVIILDRVKFEGLETSDLEDLRSTGAEMDAEIWMACRTHRDGPDPKPGYLPLPAEGFEDQVDLAFSLDPHKNRIRLHVLKDQQQMLDNDLNILLNPKTLLLKSGVKR